MHPELFMLQQTTGPPSKLVPGMKTPVHGSPATGHSTCHTAMRKQRVGRARLTGGVRWGPGDVALKPERSRTCACYREKGHCHGMLSAADHGAEQRMCVVQQRRCVVQRRGISAGLAGSGNASRTETQTPSREATQGRTVRETKHTWLSKPQHMCGYRAGLSRHDVRG